MAFLFSLLKRVLISGAYPGFSGRGGGANFQVGGLKCNFLHSGPIFLIFLLHIPPIKGFLLSLGGL